MHDSILHAYVDGSFARWGDRVRIGCGVFFGTGDPENRAAIVPFPIKSFIPPSSSTASAEPDYSLRAELYAALLCVYLAYDVKGCCADTRLIIHQDSLVAIDLLRACQFGASSTLLCPSRWASSKNNMRFEYGWGKVVTEATILAHSDVLDAWWWYTRRYDVASNAPMPRIPNIEFRWVKAHRAETCVGDGFEAKRDWHGNDVADTLAKLGASIDRTDRESVAVCTNYPLYRSDPSINLPPKTEPKLDYLPLNLTKD